MNRALRVVVCIVLCFVAAELFFMSTPMLDALMGDQPEPLNVVRTFFIRCFLLSLGVLGPGPMDGWSSLTKNHHSLAVVVPLVLVGLGLFVWLGKPKGGAGS